MNDAPILIIPGWNNSGPQHWQTLWEKAHPDYRRVEQDSWDKPRCGDWVARLDRYIAEAAAPPILVAHSLGSTAVAHWAAAHTRPVRGALLVVPPDLDSAAVFDEGGFTPVPRKRLPFPSVLVASADDPWCPMKVSEEFAEAWGSRLVNAGACGHLSTGAWPMGEALLAELAAMG